VSQDMGGCIVGFGCSWFSDFGGYLSCVVCEHVCWESGNDVSVGVCDHDWGGHFP
jgi:hypothetical protein